MVTNPRNLELAAAVMEGLLTCDEFQFIMTHDAAIKRADEEIRKAMAEASKYLPLKVFDALDIAITGQTIPYTEAGVLFGMRAVFAMREVVEHQAALSDYYVKRMESRP